MSLSVEKNENHLIKCFVILPGMREKIRSNTYFNFKHCLNTKKTLNIKSSFLFD